MIKAKRILFQSNKTVRKAYRRLVLGMISLIYYFVCVAFAGFGLSFVWIWPLFSFFCFIRFKMLTFRLKGKRMWELPKWLVYIYRGGIIAGLTLFVLVESQVIMSMNTKPENNLDYVIVLNIAGYLAIFPDCIKVYIKFRKGRCENKNHTCLFIALSL